MKKIALAIVAVIALSGCGSVEEGNPASGVVTIQYNGRPLDCLVFEGSYAKNYACDFVKYHANDSEFE